MKLEWWYADAVYHASRQTTVALARLAVTPDGSAHLLTDGGEGIDFETEDEAVGWLLDEEYRRLDDLILDRREHGLTPDERLKPPTASEQSELLRQMVIELEPQAAPSRQGGASRD